MPRSKGGVLYVGRRPWQQLKQIFFNFFFGRCFEAIEERIGGHIYPGRSARQSCPAAPVTGLAGYRRTMFGSPARTFQTDQAFATR